MSEQLVTVEQAAAELRLHVKTVQRYIREGKLPAVRLGKAYRISRSSLNLFAGVADGRADAEGVRATCIVEVPEITGSRAGKLADFLHSAALSGDGTAPPLHLQTAFDPGSDSMKVVVIGTPSDAGRLLEMLQLHLRARS
jgi:excisionase family DNA binding protein